MQSNLPNIWMATTNAVCLYPVLVALTAGDWYTAIIIGAAGVFSGLYHLFESHVHSMNGFGCPAATSRQLLWIDRLGVVLAVARVLYLVQAQWSHTYEAIPTYMWGLAFALSMAALSEYDTYAKSADPWNAHATYIMSHSIWHISIFSITGNALYELVYLRR